MAVSRPNVPWGRSASYLNFSAGLFFAGKMCYDKKGGEFMEEKLRILAVDDEPDLRALLRILLESKGYHTVTAASGTEAVALAREENFDLIILDIMMPDMDGIEACRQIRTFCMAPVLFLSAKTKMEDKTAAYRSGGDDYLPKPFSKTELLLKVDSMLRRYRVYQGRDTEEPGTELVLEESSGCFYRGKEMLKLTDKEFDILRYFYLHRGQVLDVQSIYEAVWQEKYMASSNNTVMVHILNLRKKLETDPANPELLKTIWGRGYRLG